MPESIQYLSGTLVLCALMWHAPNLAAGILSGAMSLNAGNSVQQIRGLTYGMLGSGGGGGGQGGGNNPAMSNATKVSTFAQPAANVAGGYFADMEKVSDSKKVHQVQNNDTIAQNGQGQAGGSSGASNMQERYKPPAMHDVKEVAATTEPKDKK